MARKWRPLGRGSLGMCTLGIAPASRVAPTSETPGDRPVMGGVGTAWQRRGARHEGKVTLFSIDKERGDDDAFDYV